MNKNQPIVAQSKPSRHSKLKTEIIYENFSEINYNAIKEAPKTTATEAEGSYKENIKLPTLTGSKDERFVLNLGAEQIALKSQRQQQQQQQQQQLINKSITTETEAKNIVRATSSLRLSNSKSQQQLRRFSFNIAPKKNVPEQQPNDYKNFSEIKLASVKRATSLTKRSLGDYLTQATPPTPPPPPPPPLPPPPVHHNTHQVEAEVYNKVLDSIDSNGGGNYNSPESLLDNILSAASSVSVQSSSSGSVTQFGTKPTLMNIERTTDDIGNNKTNGGHNVPTVKMLSKETNANRLLTLKSTATTTAGSPELRVLPATPIGDVSVASAADIVAGGSGGGGGGRNTLPHVSQKPKLPQTLQLPLTPIGAYDTSSMLSRSPSPTPTPSVSIRITTDTSLTYPEELKCNICTQVFRDPRTLHCLHSFCFQCLIDVNFKNDSNLWSQPAAEVNENLNVKNCSNYSLRSSTPEISLPANGSEQQLATVSPARQRGSSFSLRRKKSLEKIQLLKAKSDCKSSVCSSTNQLAASFAQEKLRSIECRICKQMTVLSVGGVRQLPQNFLLVRKIEELRLKAGDEVISRVWCSLCFEESNATYHCVNCTLNLCTLCKESHERQRNTANHRIKNIMELRRARKQKQSQLDGLKFAPKCSLHAGFDMKSFCTTCQQLACADCLVLLHKGHKHETVAKVIHHYTKMLRDSAEQTRPLCNYAEHSIERLNEIGKGINRKCDEIQAQVQNFMQSYYKAVEVHGNTLLQQVQRARESKIEMILEQQMDLERRTHEAMEVVHFSQELTDNATDAEILSFVSILNKRFEYCQQFKPPMDPKISDSLHFLPKIRAPATKEQNDIPLFGIITMQMVDPSLCTLQWEGFTQLRLHKRVELKLLSRDADGVPLCHGGLQLQCVIKYKESNSRFLPIDVADHRDGTYSISFSPDAQGTIILTVTINDKPIKGSPFTFLARQVRPHSGIFHCCAFCSSKGNRIVKCSCEGRMPGYNGCGHGHAGHPGRRHWSCCGNVLENSECNVANKLLNT